MNIIFNDKLKQKDKSFIQGKLDRDKYEVFILNSWLSLEVHLKNILLSNKKIEVLENGEGGLVESNLYLVNFVIKKMNIYNMNEYDDYYQTGI